jgi:hypothetical protein
MLEQDFGVRNGGGDERRRECAPSGFARRSSRRTSQRHQRAEGMINFYAAASKQITHKLRISNKYGSVTALKQ